MVVPRDESTNIFVNMETESEGRCFLQANTSKLKFMPKKPQEKRGKNEEETFQEHKQRGQAKAKQLNACKQQTQADGVLCRGKS